MRPKDAGKDDETKTQSVLDMSREAVEQRKEEMLEQIRLHIQSIKPDEGWLVVLLRGHITVELLLRIGLGYRLHLELAEMQRYKFTFPKLVELACITDCDPTFKKVLMTLNDLRNSIAHSFLPEKTAVFVNQFNSMTDVKWSDDPKERVDRVVHVVDVCLDVCLYVLSVSMDSSPLPTFTDEQRMYREMEKKKLRAVIRGEVKPRGAVRRRS
jgi:hypothetical protein